MKNSKKQKKNEKKKKKRRKRIKTSIFEPISHFDFCFFVCHQNLIVSRFLPKEQKSSEMKKKQQKNEEIILKPFPSVHNHFSVISQKNNFKSNTKSLWTK